MNQPWRERQLQDRHEAFMRHDDIFRRRKIHNERMHVLTESLEKTITAVGECADTTTKVGQRIDALVVRMDTMVLHMDIMVVRMDTMVAHMDKTDERWNQLIDQLTREHQNDGNKH